MDVPPDVQVTDGKYRLPYYTAIDGTPLWLWVGNVCLVWDDLRSLVFTYDYLNVRYRNGTTASLPITAQETDQLAEFLKHPYRR